MYSVSLNNSKTSQEELLTEKTESAVFAFMTMDLLKPAMMPVLHIPRRTQADQMMAKLSLFRDPR